MPQDRESGAAGRDYGLAMGRGLARLLSARRLNQNSNEVVWSGKRAVIKCCAPGTSSIGVTVTMLPRIEAILAAFESEAGDVAVWELSAGAFRAAMYDSASRAGDKLQMVRRSYAEKNGRAVAVFRVADVKAAAS